ncbi:MULTISPECIES: hypothetical protein [Rhodococcus]|uniref:hypothetical protein n=1 Tax=Rhodococcus TaxID=1827 RepID=UPI000A6CC8E8|nr:MULTISPECIES: hypothetical protein [Rhodococcus]MBX9150042.1 hypothetical protein [Rhodococcus qingshengii]MCE4161672.1 hypothetical protein [Rhodococcus sp. Ni2]
MIRVPKVYVFDNGDKITIREDPDRNCLTIHGSGHRIGKLSIEPNGSNSFDVRVIE